MSSSELIAQQFIDGGVVPSVLNAQAPGNHAAKHLPNGSDPISYANASIGGLMSPSQVTQLDNKLDKTGTITVSQISKNAGLIDQTYLTDELKQQIAGTAPINAVPADASITPNKTTFMRSVQNLFNKTTVTSGIISGATGVIVANSSYSASDYIEVTPTKVYNITACFDCAYFNASHVFISGFSSAGAPITITAPAGAAYIRITFSNAALATAMFVLGTLPSSYLGFGYHIEITDAEFKNVISSSIATTSKWTGKIWNVIGDSITEHNDKTTKNYQDYIASKISCTVNNYGLSGTGWFTPWGGNAAFYNRLVALASNADLITVFGGTNDWGETGKTLVLGSFGDTDPALTFYGAVDYTIRQLVTMFPTKTIAVFTPIPRNNSWGTSSTGVTLEQITDAIIKVCARYSVPVLDLYRKGNVYAWDANYRTYALPDGLHPNDNGHVTLADKILDFLNSL